MRFPAPLHKGRLLRRYKRFLADIALDDGREITAHCANPGSMMGVAIEGATVWASAHDNPKRKLPWSWDLVDADGALIPVNAANANGIAAEALAQRAIPELAGYRDIAREVKYGPGSRIDFLLTAPRKAPCYVEVKNVCLSRETGLAEFPDAVTARGRKHLHELTAALSEGARAVMLFIVQRSDCRLFRPAADIDPAYAESLAAAAQAGVRVLCYDCEVTTAEVTLRKPLETDISR